MCACVHKCILTVFWRVWPLYLVFFGNVLIHSIVLGSRSRAIVGSSAELSATCIIFPSCPAANQDCPDTNQDHVNCDHLFTRVRLAYWGSDISKLNPANFENFMHLNGWTFFQPPGNVFLTCCKLRPPCHKSRVSCQKLRPPWHKSRLCPRLWQVSLDLQQVGKIFPGGRKNFRPFSCIECSKLVRFSFDILLPQYGNHTKVNRWSQLVLHLVDICSLL